MTTTIIHGADSRAGNGSKRALYDVIVLLGICALFGVTVYLLNAVGTPIGPSGIPSTISTNLNQLPYYAMRSVFRMMIALGFSLLFTFIYGLAAARSRILRPILIPLLDILQSIPILGFLSATITIWLVLFPHSMMGVEAASIFAIFTSQAWNMTFSFYRSLQSEPTELDEAARSLRLTNWQRFWKLDVPNSTIPLIWNCMMSVGGGWFFLTASEMISVNNKTYVLPGIGSFVGQAAKEENPGKIAWAIITMILVVVLLDIFLWKPLVAWAEKFRITQNEGAEVKTSLVLFVIRQSHLDEILGTLLSPIGSVLDVITRPLGITGSHWELRGGRRKAMTIVTGAIMALLLVFGLGQLITTISRGTGFGQLGHVLGLGTITFMRVAVLLIICSLIWVPIGSLIGMNPRALHVMQPIVQILASFPANFIFPLITMIFITFNIDNNWGCILLMALGTQWYILFNIIAGASAIPNDLKEMGKNIGMHGWLRWKTLILPSVFGSWCTGGLTAAGGAWNASIVSEIVSYGKHTLTAKGLGAYIAQSTATGNMPETIIGITAMSIFVVGINLLLWNPLHRLAARRFSLN
jgi:NitT/TauT family transport system permease protein